MEPLQGDAVFWLTAGRMSLWLQLGGHYYHLESGGKIGVNSGISILGTSNCLREAEWT